MPKVFFARFAGLGFESLDTGSWAIHLAWQMAHNGFGEGDLHVFTCTQPRIAASRNYAVKAALEAECDLILMLDPDMAPDIYFDPKTGRTPDAEPFFWSAKRLLADNPVSVCCAPYCGGSDDMPLHVFTRDEQKRIVRMKREDAAKLRGWCEVAACGTGLMLIDLEVFRRIPPPWFSDTYKDEYESEILHTQDTGFCLKCGQHGIPVYTNFSAWSGHHRNMLIGKPGKSTIPLKESGIWKDTSAPIVRKVAVPEVTVTAGDPAWST